MTKNSLMTLFSILLSFVIIFYLFHKIHLEMFFNLFSTIKIPYLVLCSLIVVLAPFSGALRFHGVLRANNIQAPFSLLIKSVFFSFLLSSLLPSKGGDFLKIFYLKKSIKLQSSLSSVIIERCIDLIVLGFFGVFGYFMGGNILGLYGSLVLWSIILGIFGLSLIISQNTRLKKYSIFLKISELNQMALLLGKDKSSLLLCVLGSLGSWIIGLMIFVICLTSLNSQISIFEMLVVE